MSSSHADQILEAIKIVEKGEGIRREQKLALQRHRLATDEFEALLQKKETSETEIEAWRFKLVSLYEQYIDAGLALRTYSIDAESRIESIIKGAKS